ncbi:MAG: hypothetical protein IPN97_07760 [Saprospiraceae bacterium]|nr:hypothetical protein [Saprospiraceae bacterium]
MLLRILKKRSQLSGNSISGKDTLFSEPGIYEYVIKGSDCDQFVRLNFSWILDTNDKKTWIFPAKKENFRWNIL